MSCFLCHLVLGAVHGGLLFVVCGFWGLFCFGLPGSWLLWLGVGWGYVVWFSGLFTDCCSGLASCFVVWGWLGFCWFCLESLILAQDERWRRA